tara:strand:+ start:1612 stop:1839 length:228 start_codon:yes stop_codon:yes gene_type:complete
MLEVKANERKWSTEDGWTIIAGEQSVQIFDVDEDPVIETITKQSALKKLKDHLDSQKNHAEFEILMSALKDPVDA